MTLAAARRLCKLEHLTANYAKNPQLIALLAKITFKNSVTQRTKIISLSNLSSLLPNEFWGKHGVF